MEIVQIKCSQLLVNEGQVEGLPTNPRSWTKADIDRLARSLEETPELFEARPCIVYPYGDKYIVLGGNMRLTAAKKLKYKDVPCIVIPAETPIDKLKEIVIKDNGAFGAWDFDELANKWDDLPLTDWGVPAWEEKHLEETEQEVAEDDFDETADHVETRCQKGNIWKLGEHRLMCGDSTSETDVAELMDGQKAELTITDPPYGINVVSKDGSVGGENLCEVGVYAPVIGDDTTETAEKAYKILVENSDKQIIFGGNYFTEFLPFSDGWLIWDKRGESGIRNNFADGEMAWCSFHTPVRIYHQLWCEMIKEGEHDKRVHPTQKPVKMIADIMRDFSAEKNLILDLFGGSGTTMIAAEQLGRKAYLMELDPHYCDVIIARWEKLTGKTAVKL